MSAPTAPAPPAGWYEDPWDAGALRYFDGCQWTVQTAPSPAGRPLPVGPHPMPTPAQAAPTLSQGTDALMHPRDQVRPGLGSPARDPEHRPVVLVAAAAVLAALVAAALLLL